MFKNYIGKLKTDSNTNNVSMQRLDLSDEFDFDKLTTKSVSSEVLDNIEIDNSSLQTNTQINNPTPDIVIRPSELIELNSSNKANNFISRNFSSITCLAILATLILGLALFLVSSISLIIAFTKPAPYFQYYNGSDLINLVLNDKSKMFLFLLHSTIFSLSKIKILVNEKIIHFYFVCQ
jgi:hypothetical protein